MTSNPFPARVDSLVFHLAFLLISALPTAGSCLLYETTLGSWEQRWKIQQNLARKMDGSLTNWAIRRWEESWKSRALAISSFPRMRCDSFWTGFSAGLN